MKKTRARFLLCIVLFLVPLILGIETVNTQNKVVKKEEKTSEHVLNTMLESRPGADPLTLVAGSNNYLVLEHYSGLLILDRNFLEPVAGIPAKEIGLKTQGDGAFSYSLDGNALFLQPMGSGKSYRFNILDKVLQEDQGKDSVNKQDSMKALSEDQLEEILGKKTHGQGIQGDHWLCILIPDWNTPGKSQLIMVDQDRGKKQVKNLADLVKSKEGASIYLDDKPLASKGFVKKGKAYLPLRSILEGQGYEVEWNQKESSIGIKWKNHKILMVPNGQSYSLTLDGKKRTYDFYTRENRTYMGRKFFQEIMGLDLVID